MRGSSRGSEGGMGEEGEVFCSMQFLASTNHGRRRHPMAAMKPHSRLLHIQQSVNIVCDRLILLKLEKTFIINVY